MTGSTRPDGNGKVRTALPQNTRGRISSVGDEIARDGRTRAEMFWEKVDRRGAGECWPWLAYVSPGGYGCFRFSGRMRRAHRFSILLSGREIPTGMVVDHMCRNRCCVNPAHLRIVTRQINAIENSIGPAAANVLKTHCSKGHPFDEANTRRRKNSRKRDCKACSNAAAKIAQRRAYREWRAANPKKPMVGLRGERNGRCEVSDAACRQMIERRRQGATIGVLLTEFGAPKSTIYRILRGERHVD